MEELVRKGLCKAIGISNFSSTKVKALLETAEIVPATNQGEYLSFWTVLVHLHHYHLYSTYTNVFQTPNCTVYM